MGSCNIDHSLDDVKKKLKGQRIYLPENLVERLEKALIDDLSQGSLNDIFHLLKKYDLAPDSEREKRNQKLAAYI
ncbi:hypothetical protein [Pseudogracilibacillus sp. SO30301A]|uniref:hypothetical protein n=1 Tax=Pseudogracilibacillus sp. SO30301A TaxID=3098291 RepID=UPI00300DEE30